MIVEDNPTKILVVGTGRSGTNHFASVCQNLNVDVGHEEMKSEGISSWCLVSDQPEAPYGPSLQELNSNEFVIGHQLRNPMKTIPSLMTINKESWAFIQDDAKGRIPMKWWNRAPLRVKAMWHWLDWNQRAEEMAEIHWTLDSASELGTILADALDRPELAEKWEAEWTSENVHTNDAQSRISGLHRIWGTSPIVAYRRWRHARGHYPATEEALFEADPTLARDIMQFWREFVKNLDLPTKK